MSGGCKIERCKTGIGAVPDTEKRIYLDNNATTPVLPEVRQAMISAMTDCFGNPSSVHADGAAARRVLNQAREAVANLIGASDPETIIFTSGGTESNNLVLFSMLACTSRPPRIIATVTEHSSVAKTLEHFSARGQASVQFLPVDANGCIALAEFEKEVARGVDLVSIHWVNGETGVIQDIPAIAAICRKAGCLLHTDAAQALGKLEIDVTRLPVDFLTCSAHKIHGPKGVGAVFVRNKAQLFSQMLGGPQEFGLRPGTENVPGIAGFGSAASLRVNCLHDAISAMRELRDRFESCVTSKLPTISINGCAAQRICSTSNVRFTGIEGAAIVAQLDSMGISCSQSSACTNRLPHPSSVLLAMGLTDDEAFSSVRFGFSPLNQQAEIDAVVEVILRVYEALNAA
jgi:cysteine desulfurase